MDRTQRRPVAGQKVYASVRASIPLFLLALCVLAPGGFGCARKAPGPDECVAFAKVWVERRSGALEPPMLAADPFDELVRDCLTKPYDRALVECVIQGTPPDRCRVEYARRVEQSREERYR
jgi:hypothetical protein